MNCSLIGTVYRYRACTSMDKHAIIEFGAHPACSLIETTSWYSHLFAVYKRTLTRLGTYQNIVWLRLYSDIASIEAYKHISASLQSLAFIGGSLVETTYRIHKNCAVFENVFVIGWRWWQLVTVFCTQGSYCHQLSPERCRSSLPPWGRGTVARRWKE